MDLELLNVNPKIFQVFILPLSNLDFIGGFIDTHIPEVILNYVYHWLTIPMLPGVTEPRLSLYK